MLDVGLPGIDGFEVCRRVRASSSVPVIMLTARDEEADRVVGLELGADDYVPKPFSPRELVARVKAVLRRTQRRPAADGSTCGDVELRRDAREASRAGVALDLTMKEFDLLACFWRTPAWRSRASSCSSRSGASSSRAARAPSTSTWRSCAPSSARRPRIETLRGVGYKLVRP